MGWVPMLVEGVARCGCSAEHPVLALREQEGERWMNVRLGCLEAGHLAAELAGRRTRSSATYRLVDETLSALGWEISRVRLRSEDEGGLFALIELVDGSRRAGVRAHPGDAVVVATRSVQPIEVPEAMARKEPPVPLVPWSAEHGGGELVEFRRFVERVRPSDFE